MGADKNTAVWRKALNLTAAGAVLAALVLYYAAYPVPKNILYHFSSAAGAAVIIIIYILTGAGIMKLFGAKVKTGGDYAAAFGISYILTGTIFFAAGFFHLYNIYFAYGYAIVMCAFFAPMASELLENLKKKYLEIKASKFTAADIVFGAFIGAAVLLVFLTVITPGTYYDQLVYHQGIPARYAAEGGFVSTPENIFSFFPQLHMMNNLFISFFAYELTVKIISFAMLVFSFLALRSAVKAVKGNQKVLAALFFTAPLVIINATRTGAEFPMVFFTALIIYAVYSGNKERYLLASLFAGACMAVKYTGIYIYVFTAFYFVYEGLKRREKALRLLIYLAVGALITVPYLAKNFVLTGDPVYPFFAGLFGVNGYMLSDAQNYIKHVSDFGIGTGIKEFLISPFIAVFKNMAFGGDAVSAALVIAPLALLVSGIKNMWFPAAFAVFYYTVWFFTAGVLRFMAPVEAAAVFIIAASYARFAERNKGAFLKILAVLLVISQASMTLYFAEKYLSPLSFFTQDRESYLAGKLSYYEPCRKINALPENGRVLFLGEARTFYCEKTVIAHTVFNTREYLPLEEKNFITYLKEKNVGYVFVNRVELQRLKDGGFGDVYEAVNSSVFKNIMDKNFESIYSDNNWGIFELKK